MHDPSATVKAGETLRLRPNASVAWLEASPEILLLAANGTAFRCSNGKSVLDLLKRVQSGQPVACPDGDFSQVFEHLLRVGAVERV